MGEVTEKNGHDRWTARYRNHVQNRLEEDDRSDSFEPELGTVYRCQELRCSHLPSHGHMRRAYLIWMRP